MYAGGQSVADIREIRNDYALRDLLLLKTVPSESAIGDWLKKMGSRGGIGSINNAIDYINAKIFAQSDINELTLCNDPTIIETSKRDAVMTYIGVKGYRPGLAFILELNIVLAQEFREGNDMGNKLEFLKSAFSKVPKGKTIKNVLLDAEFYTADIINFLDQRCTWAITADQDAAVKATIQHISEDAWRPLLDKDGFDTGKKIAGTVHCMAKTKKAFRLAVIRWYDKKGNICYHAVASNKSDGDANSVILYYNHRATAEKVIEEVKGGFGMEKMPSGDFRANALYFSIGILTYNLFIAQKFMTMPKEFQNKTIASIRWILVEVPGKVIRHANKTILKIATTVEKFAIFLSMRGATECMSSA
jgi:hypothetical protein